MKRTVVFKPDAVRVIRQPRRSRVRGKIFVHTLAAAFIHYNEALQQADLLFDTFSEERLNAQRIALDRLKARLDELGFTKVDWTDAYSNVVQYTKFKPRNVA